jgi:hypothetical protein
VINHKLLCLLEKKCWHEPDRRSGSAKCIHCGMWIDMDDVGNLCKAYNPDYSSPNTYIPFLQWFWKEKREMWEEFGNWQWERWFQEDEALRPYTINSNYMWLFSLTTEGEPRIMVLLSEWLALPETREMWGWEECPYRKEWHRTAKDGGSSFFCEKECKQEPPPCNGTGRIKAEWAKGAERG